MKIIGMILPGINFKKQKKGFTLIEALVYIALLSLVLVSVVTLMYWILDNRSKTQVISEVELQSVLAIDRISQSIRNATGINSPTAGNTASTLSLAMADANKNPTIIDLSGGVIRIKEGAGAVTPITTSRLTITSLSFYNVTRTSTPGSIKASFTATYLNPGNARPFEYSKNYYFAANPRGY